MNAQTPRMAAAITYAQTGDLEAAYLAGYAAEGRVGAGVAPSFVDGHSAGHRTDRRKQYNKGVMQKIVRAVAEGYRTAPEIGDHLGIGRTYAANYLRRLSDQGKLRQVGTQKVGYAKSILWGLASEGQA